MTEIDALARHISRKSSLQTYLTIKLLTDKGMANDAYKAYAYFRWLDDEIDTNLATVTERQRLIKRQKQVIVSAYKYQNLPNLSTQERIIYDLIKSDSEPESKLKSFILKFFSIIEFDVKRKHKTISEKEVDWYSQTIGEAVTDCIEHFIDHDTDHPPSKNRYKAAMAAHIVHSLRDLKQDIQNGYINIPQEYLKEHGIDIGNYQDEQIAGWIRKRVAVAHRYFCDGKSYISTLPFSRRRLAAALYCLRFKPLLKIIEKDRYLLRNNYQMGMSFIIKSLLTL